MSNEKDSSESVRIYSSPEDPVNVVLPPGGGGLTDDELRATPVPISGTVACTGTFYQATQPVSGAFYQATQPVSGTFWQATQPVSAASLPLPAGAATSALQAIPTLTKGTQGSTGYSVQDLKDSGRVYCNFSSAAVATVTSEALITLTPYRDLVAGSTGTTFAVTSNKRLRLQQMVVTVRCTSTVNVGGVVRLRFLAGTVLVGSPVHVSVACQGSNLATAVIGNAQTFAVDIPEGLELSGTMQLGMTQLFSATSATVEVQLIGYEY